MVAKLGRRQRVGLGVLLRPRLLDLGAAQDCVDLAVEQVDDRLRGADRHHHADPDGGLVAGNAGLGEGRDVGQRDRARAPAGAQGLDLVGLDQRRHRGHRVEHHLDLAAEDVVARARAAAIGNMDKVGARQVFEQLARHVVVRALAGRGVVELAGLGLRERDEFLHVVGRHGRVHHHHELGAKQHRDRNEVAQQLIGLVGDQGLVDGLGGRHHDQGVAVGRRLRAFGGADHRAGARPVLHHEALLERLPQLLREHARENVGRAAGAERHDHPDHMVGIILLRHGGRGQGQAEGHAGQCYAVPQGRHRGASPS